MQEPRVGTKKIHQKLQGQGVTIGRDALFKLLGRNGMLVKRKKKASRTTYSKHSYAVAPNRIKDLRDMKPLSVLVGDITYLRLANGKFAYLYLVSDLYSRKIVGHHASLDLTHHSALVALGRAVETVGRDAINGAIHHTDRGSQYCCHEYLKALSDLGMSASMTDENHCYQNAVAERINGILKDEFDLDMEFPSMTRLQAVVAESIRIYNYERIHWSLGLRTPQQVFSDVA